MRVEHKDKRIIVALDFPSTVHALKFAQRLDPHSCRLKVGFELFVSAGPELVNTLVMRGYDVFLDLKLHDIPNTVAAACRSAARLGVWMLNVHASGGRVMLEAAVAALSDFEDPPKLIAVTVLTSLDDADLVQQGIHRTVHEQALEMASLAKSTSLDGVVCSAREAALMRRALGDEFLLVTPGIRPQGAAADDQKRIMTPVEAVSEGSDFLVVGRPITRAPDPMHVVETINSEIGSVS
jgi:orotidine-5'-phosphate decarboxylase